MNRHAVPAGINPQHHGIMNPYEELEAQEELLRQHRLRQQQQLHRQDNRRRRRRSPAMSDGSSSDQENSDTTYYPESEGTGRLGRRLIDPGKRFP
jgi:hypothetical protein